MRHGHEWRAWAGDPRMWGGWGPRGGGFFRAGEVRLALLSLLADGPAHGYELMKQLEKRSGGTYQASAGTVYPVLQQLEDEGLVTTEQLEGKKVYRITDAGREELTREAETVDRIWHRARGWQEWGSWLGPETAEIAGAVGRLVKASFQAAARCGADGIEEVRKVLDQARKDLEDLARK
ncbi:MAG TPA: PadR family transcriptional regulator [Longimicrobiales bacterium]